jgi:hypothetical protein
MGSSTDEGRATGPIRDLDDWVLGHHDVVTLCRGFDCHECVADPEDLGPTEPPAPSVDDGDCEVPF